MTTSHALSWCLRFPTAGKNETAWERKVAGCSCWGLKDPDEVSDLRVRDWVLNAMHFNVLVGNLPFTNTVAERLFNWNRKKTAQFPDRTENTGLEKPEGEWLTISTTAESSRETTVGQCGPQMSTRSVVEPKLSVAASSKTATVDEVTVEPKGRSRFLDQQVETYCQRCRQSWWRDVSFLSLVNGRISPSAR